MTRLNKFLASAGLGSRRSCESLIQEGRVKVNGKVVTELATKISESDQVSVNNKPCQVEKSLTLLLHKPKGFICSRVDLENRRTVYDLIPKDTPRLFYVGRLDYDSEGILLMTNQGQLSQRMTHPKFKLEKIYDIQLDREFDYKWVDKLKKGFQIESGFGRMEDVFYCPKSKKKTNIRVVLTQGLKRQIRLMLKKIGYKVVVLKRTQIGFLKLGKLKPGEWRELNDKEIKRLMRT